MTEKFVAIKGSLTRKQAEEIVARSRRNFANLLPSERARIAAIARENLEALSPEEDRAITEDALADPDNPPLDDEFFARRGRPPLENPKQAIKLRLDADLVARLRASGPGWQTRANAMLRKAVGLK